MEVSVKYLQSDPKTGVLRYRRLFPAHIRQFVGEGGKAPMELKVTLGARSITEPGAMGRFQEAERRYAAMVSRAEKLAAGAYDALDTPLIAFLVAKYTEQELAADAARRMEPAAKARGELITTAAEQAGYDLPAHRPAARWAQGVRIAIDATLEVYRGFSADGDLEGVMDAWSAPAGSLAAASGYVVDPASPAFQDLCLKLNEAAIGVYEAELQRMDGRVIPTPEVPKAPQRKDKSSASARSFNAIILELIDKPRLDFKEPTKERVRGALRFLGEAVGNLTPAELTRERVTEYLDLLALRPAKLPKRDFQLTLKQLAVRYADRPTVPRLAQKTLEAYCVVLNTRWNDAQREGSIPQALPNPFGDRKFRRTASGPRKATGFSPDELKAYFNLPAFQASDRPTRGKGDAIYWLPLLMMYTGARPEEVAQLLVTDIFQREGDRKWVIRFTDEGFHPAKGQQSLKTERQESGRRTFPIPEALIALGLLDYRKYLIGHEEVALFPLLRRKGKRSGIYASFGEWMCDYIYDNGVLARGTGRQPVREFRHTWTSAARASRIPREAMEYMQGHRAPGGGSAHEGYGERDDLGGWIEDLRFQVDVVGLVPRWRP